MKRNLINNLIKACRPKQWTKNFIVFAGPAFTFEYSYVIFTSSLIALICFCLISSSIYLINDSIDINSDKKHPKKKFRPIASGIIKIPLALITSIILALTSLFLALSLVSNSLFFIILNYFILQLIYCTHLKREPILDIFCISTGFLLRAAAGLVACNLPISPWFLLTIGMLSLFLAIEKRKFELRRSNKSGILTRTVLKSYSIPLLLRFESLVTTSCVMTYSFWAAGPILQGAKTSWMMFTIPFVIFGIFRYQLISDPSLENKANKSSKVETESPEEVLLNDSLIKLTILFWLVSITIIGVATA